jgi:hypothetical protein
MAGIRPANAPIRMAEAMPPDHASARITTAQLFVLAYTAVAAAPANADAAADDGEQDRLGEELRPDLGLWHRGRERRPISERRSSDRDDHDVVDADGTHDQCDHAGPAGRQPVGAGQSRFAHRGNAALASNSGSEPAVPVAPCPACHAGGRSLASPRGVVVKPDDSARTQNGHIRNDTRDASRRILDVSFGPICR